jgi:hypothetical protein
VLLSRDEYLRRIVDPRDPLRRLQPCAKAISGGEPANRQSDADVNGLAERLPTAGRGSCGIANEWCALAVPLPQCRERWGGSRLSRRRLDRPRPGCIDRDFAHREGDRQGSGTKQRHGPERARRTRHRADRTPVRGWRTSPRRRRRRRSLGCRSQGRRNNYRQHLHAGKVQQGECETMQRFHERHRREPGGDGGDAPADHPRAGRQRGRAGWPKPPQ